MTVGGGTLPSVPLQPPPRPGLPVLSPHPRGKSHCTGASKPLLRLRRAPGTEELRHRALLRIVRTANVTLITCQSLF